MISQISIIVPSQYTDQHLQKVCDSKETQRRERDTPTDERQEPKHQPKSMYNIPKSILPDLER